MLLTMLACLLFLVAPGKKINPSDDGTYHNKVDLIEVNTVYGEDAFPMFTQTIFWDWSPINAQYIVRAWKMNEGVWVKSEEHRKEWMKELRDLCDKYPALNFKNTSNRYRGKYDPVPGVSFPMRRRNLLEKKDYWEFIFYTDGKRIVVTAPQFRETHTQYDPERRNREIWPESVRVGLYGHSWFPAEPE